MPTHKRILVTGGAGFIGSHLVDALLEKGYEVRVYDNLDPQVHGDLREQDQWPTYLSREAELIRGDVRDQQGLIQALAGVEAVFHQAAAVGVGQSMYQIRRYAEANTLGTATLLDILANEKHRVEKLIVASSMSVYGEGKYECSTCGVVYPGLRTKEQLAGNEWEPRCPNCRKPTSPLPTDEAKPLQPTSVYAISKRDQEEMGLTVGWAYGIATVALRYFNTYGPRQALSNPYTGIAAIFSSRLLNGQAPIVFEDGRQSRDYVHVSDVVRANLLALAQNTAAYEVYNVGTGRPMTVLDVAQYLCRRLQNGIEPEVVQRFRAGDIRHCYADMTKSQNALGFTARVSFEEGLEDLLPWVEEQQALDRFDQAQGELRSKGLIQ